MSLIFELWFALSVLAFILDTVLLWHKLDNAGANPSFFWGATPGYVTKKYKEWCDSVGKSPFPRLRISWLLSANLAVAMLWLITDMWRAVTS
jgi:hypothetical protein